MIKSVLHEDITDGFIGFSVKYVKMSITFNDTNKTEREKLVVDPNKLFHSIDELLEYLMYEATYDRDISIEDGLYYYNFEQRGNMFVLSRKYSDAFVEIIFQPIVPKHTLSVYEYVHLCNGGREI